MTIKQYTKRPVSVYAVQWTGKNLKEVQDFVGLIPSEYKNATSAFQDSDFQFWSGEDAVVWATLERTWVRCPVGHYVIRGIAGEFYPCDPDVFQRTYEESE
jgi:hypothetical protein